MSTRATSIASSSSDNDSEKDRYQSSSYFNSSGFCQVFDCLEGWSSILSWKPENDKAKIPKRRHQVNDHINNKSRRNSYSQRIDPTLFRNPLAEKMVEDAVHRSKFNTKSQRDMMKSGQNGYHQDHHDKNDNILDQKIAMAARKKRQRQQAQPHPSAMSYSRRQHRLLHQQQVAQKQKQQQQEAQQECQSPLLKLYCAGKKKPERPQTPIPVPGPSRLNPKISKRRTNHQIVPKRRPNSRSSPMTLLKRKDSNDSKRQSPPTSYCPPVSTPLVPIGERKAMKEKKPKIPIRWNSSKVTPSSFQPDEYY